MMYQNPVMVHAVRARHERLGVELEIQGKLVVIDGHQG